MRFNPTLSIFAALLLFAFINTTEAQLASTIESNPDQRLDNGKESLGDQILTSSRRKTPRVAMRTAIQPKPAHDSATPLRKLAPAINSSAFEVRGSFTTALPDAVVTSFNRDQASSDFVPRPVAISQNALAQPHVAGRVYIDSPQIIANQARVANNPAQYVPDPSAPPMPRGNFFGIDEDQCCDEWEGFGNCGGLKANPGHYGQKWIRGKDACEPGRRCRCQSHKDKKECKKNCRQNCACCK